MRYDLEPRKVMGVITEVNQALQNKGFTQIEALIGLQELVGRLIVDMAQLPTGADQLKELCKNHLDSTVAVGLKVKNESVSIARV